LNDYLLNSISDINPEDETKFVIPVKTGIQYLNPFLDSRFRGNDAHLVFDKPIFTCRGKKYPAMVRKQRGDQD
jgi:hypothetical protein